MPAGASCVGSQQSNNFNGTPCHRGYIAQAQREQSRSVMGGRLLVLVVDVAMGTRMHMAEAGLRPLCSFGF